MLEPIRTAKGMIRMAYNASIKMSQKDTTPTTRHDVKHLTNLLILATILLIGCVTITIFGSAWWGTHLLPIPLLITFAAVLDYRNGTHEGYTENTDASIIKPRL
jgi:hypothetical protein